MTRQRARTSGVAGLLLLWASHLAAQVPEPRGGVVESVKLEVVNVEVYVTDRDGKAVPGLTIADFELLEDGKPLDISNFFVGDGFASRPAQTQAAPAPQGQATRPGPAPGCEDQALHLVVLVDGLHLDHTRKATLEPLAQGIETRLRPGDDVMVAAFNHSMRILCPLTTDFEQAAAAVRATYKIASEGQFSNSAAVNMVDHLTLAGPAGHDNLSYLSDAQLGSMDPEMLWSFNKTLFSSTELLVESLSGLQGRKAVLLVSQGFPPDGDVGRLNELPPRYPGLVGGPSRIWYNLYDLRLGLGRLANAGRVTFYPVDADLYGGLEPGLGAMERRNTLATLAKTTGGQVLYSPAALEKRFGELVDSVDAFYSLGFVNPHSGDGRYHRLTVNLKREGVKLRYREGYLDKPDAARQADRTAAALLARGRTNELGLEADAGPAVHDKGKTLRVPLTVSLPGSAITLLPAQDGMSGQVSILVAGADAIGRRTEVFRKEFVIPVPEEKLEDMRQQMLVFTFEVLVRQGQWTLAVTAHDELGQVESTITLVTTVQPPAAT